jgi:hypothetical protein
MMVRRSCSKVYTRVYTMGIMHNYLENIGSIHYSEGHDRGRPPETGESGDVAERRKVCPEP